MKSFVVVCVVLLSSFSTLAQKEPLLMQDSSVSEIVMWLDQTSFRHARVVLKDSWDDETRSPPWDDTKPAEYTFVFTPGFRVTNIDGCNLMLRNDAARMIEKAKVGESHLIADVWVQLDRMSWDKGRRTRRLLGAWRTEFKYRGWFSRTIIGLTLQSPEWKGPKRWVGTEIAFTFDTREMSEQFDVAFRRAIRLCRLK